MNTDRGIELAATRKAAENLSGKLRQWAETDVLETGRDGTFEFHDAEVWAAMMMEAADMIDTLNPPTAATSDTVNYDELLREQGRAGLAATRGKTDREQLVDVVTHLKMLKSFADASGPIVMQPQGKRVGKAKAISQECEAAIDALTEHLATPPKAANPITYTGKKMKDLAADAGKLEDSFVEEIDYEIWQNDECLATTDHRSEAMHYAAVYAADGQVEVWKVIKQKERIL